MRLKMRVERRKINKILTKSEIEAVGGTGVNTETI